MLVSNKFASGLFDGAGSTALQQANTLYIMVAGIFVLSITNVIFPELSRLTAHDQDEAFGAVISTTLRAVLFLLLPLMVGLMALSTPIVRLLYEWKEWTPFSTEITARALLFLSLGMVGYGIQNILSRAFYAQQKGLVPLVTGAASILVNVVLCLALAPVMDVGGLALASAISSTVSALLLLVPMGRRYKGVVNAAFWRDGAKMLLSALVMGLAVVLARDGLAAVCPDGLAGRLVVVAAPTLLGIVVYFLSAWLLRVPELRAGMQSIRDLLRKRGA
jgi:putative peptidoglycan lipid II flippase